MDERKLTEKIISHICTLCVITAMICAAEQLGEKEIIFPEIASIATGCFLAPKIPWRTDFLRMLLFIEICAVLGVLIVCYVPLSLTMQVIFAYVSGQLIYLYSGTSFAPMISAIVLPVLIQTRTPVYLIAAFILTALIICLRKAVELFGIKRKETAEFMPVSKPNREKISQMVFRSIYASVIISLALDAGARFIIAPPLLVAFTELTNKAHPAIRKKPAVIALVSLCALTGAVCRLILTVRMQLPLAVTAVVVCLIFMLLMDLFRLHLPPAGAMAVLALLIPEEAIAVYPLYALIGITLLVIGAASCISLPEAAARRKKPGDFFTE